MAATGPATTDCSEAGGEARGALEAPPDGHASATGAGRGGCGGSGAGARPVAALLSRATKPPLGIGEARELALVAAQGCDLAVERVADVDQLVRLVRAPQEQLGHLPGLESGFDLLPEVERIPSGR